MQKNWAVVTSPMSIHLSLQKPYTYGHRVWLYTYNHATGNKLEVITTEQEQTGNQLKMTGNAPKVTFTDRK